MRLLSPKALGNLIYHVGKLVSKFYRIQVYCDPEVDLNKQYLSAFWHGKLFLPVFVMPRVGYEKRAVLVSHSKDGEILATWLSKMGYHVVRGSSSRRGMGGLVRLLSSAKQGFSISIAADGPRGPRHQVKTGIAFTAQKSGLEILPVGVEVTHKKVFKKSWDQYELPLPFSKAVLYLGKPLKVEGDVPPEEYKNQIEIAIVAAQAQAASILLGQEPVGLVRVSLDPL